MLSHLNFFNRNPDHGFGTRKCNAYSSIIYGPHTKLCIDNWGKTDIHDDILLAFGDMNIRKMKHIQQYSYFYLMKKYNTAMISSCKGKSISYLTSILSSILNNNTPKKLENIAIAPIAIIFSNSLESCTVLEDLTKRLMSKGKTQQIKVVVINSNISVEHTTYKLCKGCDIIIATPTSLLNLLNNTNIFKWSNLKHFVFDNLDLLLENYKNQMLDCLQKSTKLEKYMSNIQMISSSVKWTKDIDKFLKKNFVNWQYIFGSHFEAARYMKVEYSIVQVKDDKLIQIIEILKKNMHCQRWILITSNLNELNEIYKFIHKNYTDIEVLLPSDLKFTRGFTLRKWKSALEKSQRIMICSDDMMFEFCIDSADCLIHYDIPLEKYILSIRFSVLQDPNNFPIIKKRHTYFILNKNNSNEIAQLPKIIKTMQVFDDAEVDPMLINKDFENMKIVTSMNDDVNEETLSEITAVTPIIEKNPINDFESMEISMNDDMKEESITELTTLLPIFDNTPINVCTYTESSKNIKPVDPAGIIKEKTVAINQYLCMEHNTNMRSIAPECRWCQYDDVVFIKINLLEVDTYKINYTNEYITFNASFKNKSYRLHCFLYDLIDKNTADLKRGIEGFYIRLEKLRKKKFWRRLNKCKKWHKNIKYDPGLLTNNNHCSQIKDMKQGTHLSTLTEETDFDIL